MAGGLLYTNIKRKIIAEGSRDFNVKMYSTRVVGMITRSKHRDGVLNQLDCYIVYHIVWSQYVCMASGFTVYTSASVSQLQQLSYNCTEYKLI